MHVNCVHMPVPSSIIPLLNPCTQVTPGGKLAPEYCQENLDLLEKGLPHLTKQIDNVQQFGVPCVVAVNR